MESVSFENNARPSAQQLAPDDYTPRYSRRETLLTMAGVLLVMLLASLDQTIVATAMPHVISELQGFDRYTWVTTAYLLTSTVMIPIYGKLSDMFGRKPIFLIGVVLFLTGSALSGAAQTMNQLIAFRAFQGLGAAALMPIAMAVVGDLFTPRERGRWQGVTGAVFGLSSILGPLVGGWITENVSWRWIFYVNLPVGILALLVLIFLMPSVGKKSKTAAIDYLGAALLIIATVPMLLGFTWAGGQYPWLSPQIIGLFAGSLIAFVAFFVYEAYLERRERQPIIDPSLFKNQTFSLSVMITMITSMGMFGAIFFLPLFAQGVLNISATNSGLQLTPLMLALICSSIISGQLVSRFGKYKWIAITGMFIAAAGSLLLLRLDIQSTIVDLLAAMIVLGLGLGFSMALYTLIVQNAMPHKLGQATATLSFFRQIGGTVALAALGSVMSTSYVPNFHNALPNMVKSLVPPDKLTAFDNPNILLSPEIQRQVQQAFATFGPAGQQLYKAIMGAVKIGLAQGIHNTFIFSVALMAIGLVLVCFIKEVPLRGGAARRRETNTDNAPDTTAEVEPVAIR